MTGNCRALSLSADAATAIGRLGDCEEYSPEWRRRQLRAVALLALHRANELTPYPTRETRRQYVAAPDSDFDPIHLGC